MNYISFIISAILPMVMGFIYYHPAVMGSTWMKANGFTLEGMTPPKPIMYLLALGTSVLLASFFWNWVTGAGGQDQMQVIAKDGHSYVTFQHGAVHGIIFGITVLLPIFVTMKIFEQRN